VGYGEITPRSFLGRLVTLPLLVFGLLLIALPSFVLGREFTIVWEILSKEGVCFLSLDHRHYAGPISRMIQDRYEDLLRGPAIGRGGTTTDLSNFKLAENQTELSKQISELRTTVEEQGILLRRLLDAVEKGKQREEY